MPMQVDDLNELTASPEGLPISALPTASALSSASRLSGPPSECASALRAANWHCAPRTRRCADTPRRPAPRPTRPAPHPVRRSEEHTSELQSLMRISYAVFCLKKKKNQD